MDIIYPMAEAGCQVENIAAHDLSQAAFNAATDATRSRDDRIEAYSWRDAASIRQDWLIEERNRLHGIEFAAAMQQARRQQ